MNEIRIWSDSDHELVLQLVLRSQGEHSLMLVRKPARWVEFTISRPLTGPQGVELDPIVEGIVTPERREYATLGMIDSDPIAVAAAIARAYGEARKLLEE